MLNITPNDPCFPTNSLMMPCQSTSLYGLSKIGAPTAWDTTTGSSNVVVGVIDEGIDINHPDLPQQHLGKSAPGSIPGFTGDINGWDFFHNDATVFDNTGAYTVPCGVGCDETDAHATHVAGNDRGGGK